MPSTNFTSITPLIPAGPSLADALKFYTGQMGFEILWQGAGIAGIRRGAVALNIMESDDRAWAENTSFSIGVDDLDGLYDEYRGIDARIGPLEVKSWGRREFHVIISSGVCIQFFQHPA